MQKKHKLKRENTKYGQAALEYLMTYGWAIVVVLAIIAILAFIVRPQPVETCQIQPPFECIPGAYAVYKSNDTLVISLKNSGYEQIKLVQTACGYNGTAYTNLMDVVGPSGKLLSVGDVYNLQFNCTGITESTAKIGQDVFQGDVYILYYPRASDTTLIKTTSVRIAAKYA